MVEPTTPVVTEPVAPVAPVKPAEPTKTDSSDKSEMRAMKKQLKELQASHDALNKEKDQMTRDKLLVELKGVNEASALRNKDASIARLEIALEEAKDIRAELPDFPGKPAGEPAKNPLDVGEYVPDKTDWI